MPQSTGDAGATPDKAMFSQERRWRWRWMDSKCWPHTPWRPAGSHSAVTHTGTTEAPSKVPKLGLHVYVRAAKPQSAVMEICNMKDARSHGAPSIPGGAAGEWTIYSAHKTPHWYVMHMQPCTKHKSIEVHNVIWTEIEWSHKKGAQQMKSCVSPPPHFLLFSCTNILIIKELIVVLLEI